MQLNDSIDAENAVFNGISRAPNRERPDSTLTDSSLFHRLIVLQALVLLQSSISILHYSLGRSSHGVLPIPKCQRLSQCITKDVSAILTIEYYCHALLRAHSATGTAIGWSVPNLAGSNCTYTSCMMAEAPFELVESEPPLVTLKAVKWRLCFVTIAHRKKGNLICKDEFVSSRPPREIYSKGSKLFWPDTR
jgi:hypothetical protein